MLGSIIVICTGNICRSPMAEALLAQRLQQAGGSVRVSSAGIAALHGHAADPLAQQVMQEQGLDISRHRARQVSPDLLLGSDLVLVLEQLHQDWIRSRHPALQGRVFKLGRWRDNADIADPYRGPKAEFERAYDEIRQCTEDWLSRIGTA